MEEKKTLKVTMSIIVVVDDKHGLDTMCRQVCAYFVNRVEIKLLNV